MRNARDVSSLAVKRVSTLLIAILFHRLFLPVVLNLNVDRPFHKLINRHFGFDFLDRLAQFLSEKKLELPFLALP